MKKILLVLIACCTFFVARGMDNLTGEVYPAPQQILGKAEPVVLSGKIEFQTDRADNVMLNYGMNHLRSLLAGGKCASGGKDLIIVNGLLSDGNITAALGDIAVPENLPAQGYIIRTVENSSDVLKVVAAGSDLRGAFYALVTLGQMLKTADGVLVLNLADINDYPDWTNRYVSDDVDPGNYEKYMRLALNKFSSFAWQFRSDWRQLEPNGRNKPTFETIQKVEKEGFLDFMFLLHVYAGSAPNSSNFDIANEEHIQGLIQRCREIASYSINTIMICVDDYTPRKGDEYTFFPEDNPAVFDNSVGKAHGYLMQRLYIALQPEFPDLKLAMVGAPYSLNHGIGKPGIDKYVLDWGRVAPREVAWVWTGKEVLSDVIEKDHLVQFTNLLNGQPTFLWDNSNCFDTPMPVWETVFYDGFIGDSGNLVYLNDRIFFDKNWSWLYSMTANSYLWNAESHNPERAFALAVAMTYGNQAVKPVVEFRNALLAVQRAIQAGDRTNAEELVAVLNRAYENMPVKDARLEAAVKLAREFAEIKPLQAELEPVSTPVTVDGEVSEAEWGKATVLPMQSRNGKPVTMPSECRVQYAPEGLYLAFMVKNSDELKDIGKLERDRSVYLHDDCIELFIQPSPSGAYGHFCFDYEGNQFDEPEAEGGFMWNPDWRVATKRNADGWTAEVFIPVIELEKIGPRPLTPGTIWRGNIVRVNNKRGEIEVWTPGGENFHSYQYFGELKFK